MERTHHRFSELFAQLGLASDPASIALFLQQHRPLPSALHLADAPFWSASQAALLREQLSQDADWAETVDQLNAALRA